jgi:hypothetical protein
MRGQLVSNTKELEAAEARMNTAKENLLHYIEKHQTIDRNRHRQLIARLKKAQAEFLSQSRRWANRKTAPRWHFCQMTG